MTIRDQVIDEIIEREGGERYSNRAEDLGGPTRWGVTQSTARQFGYQGDMRVYPRSEALRVYQAMWQQMRLNVIESQDADLASYMMDYGVNSGPGNAAMALQRLLTVLNDRARLYPDIKPDGAIGPATLAALDAYCKARGASGKRVLAESLNALRIAHCVQLAERSEVQEANLFGWLNRVVNL